jgi:hypothetical protein
MPTGLINAPPEGSILCSPVVPLICATVPPPWFAVRTRPPDAVAGRLCFDYSRGNHRAAKLNRAHINEAPEGFTVRPGADDQVAIDNAEPALAKG